MTMYLEKKMLRFEIMFSEKQLMSVNLLLGPNYFPTTTTATYTSYDISNINFLM